MIGSFIRYPRAAGTSYTARQVATAYNFPLTNTGQGYTCGIIELGGGFSPSDLESYFGSLNLPVPDVTAVPDVVTANLDA